MLNLLWMVIVTILIASPLSFVQALTLFAILRVFDKLGGQNFRTGIWVKLHENPLALAIYSGLRILAVAVLVLGNALVVAGLLFIDPR